MHQNQEWWVSSTKFGPEVAFSLKNPSTEVLNSITIVASGAKECNWDCLISMGEQRLSEYPKQPHWSTNCRGQMTVVRHIAVDHLNASKTHLDGHELDSAQRVLNQKTSLEDSNGLVVHSQAQVDAILSGRFRRYVNSLSRTQCVHYTNASSATCPKLVAAASCKLIWELACCTSQFSWTGRTLPTSQPN